MSYASSRIPVAICGIVLLCQVSAKADFPELTRRVPKDANVILYMDVYRLMASPMAVNEDWKGKRAADYHNRPLTIPPAVTRLVRAAHFDIDLDKSSWQIAVMEVNAVPPLETIAKREKGNVDTVAGTKAVWSPHGAYIIKLSDNTVGLMLPANRQSLSRWIKEKSGESPSYLVNTSREMTPTGPQLLIAMDLEDVVQPDVIRERVNGVEALKNTGVNLDVLVRTLAGIQGVRFAVTVKEKAMGKITVDFKDDASVLKDVGKPLLLHALQNHGLVMDDLEAWTASVSKKSFVLEGEFSRSGLMRLSSLMDLPSLPLDDSERDADTVDAGDPKLYATLNYFKSLQALMNDLNEKRKEFQNPGHAAGWWETYAKRIGRLPILNVDDDMLKYSLDLVELMRQGVEQFRGGAIQAGVQQANLATTYGPGTGYGYGYGGYGRFGGGAYSGARQEQAQSDLIRAQQTGQAAMAGTEIRNQIQDGTLKIRRLMTERYKVEF